MYECRANVILDDSTPSRTVHVDVKRINHLNWYLFDKLSYTIFISAATQAPKIEETNLRPNKPMKKALGEPLRLQCMFSGTPVPQISWYKVRLLTRFVLESPNN